MMVCWCQWQKVYFTQLFLQNHKCFYNTQGLHSSLIFRSRTSAFLLFCCFLYLFMLSWWYVNFFWTLVSFSSVSVQPEFSDSLFFPSSVTSIRLNAAQWEEIVQDTTYFCKDLFHLRSRMEGIGIVSTSSLKSTLILVTRSMYKVFVFISENNKQISLFGSGCLKLKDKYWNTFFPSSASIYYRKGLSGKYYFDTQFTDLYFLQFWAAFWLFPTFLHLWCLSNKHLMFKEQSKSI